MITLRAERTPGGAHLDFFYIREGVVENAIQLHPNYLEAHLVNTYVGDKVLREKFHADLAAQGWAEVKLLD
jgi:hypothetical protein